MVRGVSDGFMEAFQPYLTVYASDPELQGEPGRHQQQERRRLHAAAHGRHPRRRHARSDQAARPIRPSSTTAGSTRWPASLCDRASAAGFDSLSTITSLLPEPADRGAARRSALPDVPVDAAASPIRRRRSGEASPTSGRRASTASSPPASRAG